METPYKFSRSLQFSLRSRFSRFDFHFVLASLSIYSLRFSLRSMAASAKKIDTPDFIKTMRDAKSKDEQLQARLALANYLKPRLYYDDNKSGKDELNFLLTNTDFPSVMVTAIREWHPHYSLGCVYMISELGSRGYSLTEVVDEGIVEIIVNRFLPDCKTTTVIRAVWVIMQTSDHAIQHIYDIPDVMNILKSTRSQAQMSPSINYIDMIYDNLSNISRRSIKAARN